MSAGLYIHVPFCASVCPYCDFAVTLAGEERRQAYVAGIGREAALAAADGLKFDTVYLGGGTPSALAADQLGEILGAVRGRLQVGEDTWTFLEINPEDVSAASVSAWRELEVRTVSLGVQSFDDAALGFLGRRHTADDARRALDRLREGGFATVSLDLIYGLPGQSADGWCRQLEEAAARSADHLSCYQLTIHSGTVFGRRQARGSLGEAVEPVQAELFLLTHRVLAELGYEGYEVSNFATAPRHRSRHNLKYWSHEPYLGLGPSAHSFVGRRRFWNQRRLRAWQRAVDAGCRPLEGSEELGDAELALEAIMLGLRTADGVDLGSLRSRYGVDLVELNRRAIERFCDGGHLVLDSGRLRPTVSGMAIADTLARELEVGASG
ncbi:MAG: coproporphyrinogen III oxidase [Holophagae bacterium]|nr:MAG: coproporphyrinogen III oxidase [Holophagae bacterium]